MDFRNIVLPEGMDEILTAIYKKAQLVNPSLTESLFLQRIIDTWLEPYSRTRNHPISKDSASLKNRLKEAIKSSGKTQAQIAQEIGINRTYLGQVVSGKSEPTIMIALLLANVLNEIVTDLFYLE